MEFTYVKRWPSTSSEAVLKDYITEARVLDLTKVVDKIEKEHLVPLKNQEKRIFDFKNNEFKR